ncbi:hypothetical protein SAMN04487861_11127 [Selenomonas ruminantium]|uniref:Transposon-encoded protein TnpV n=1 Tax=Selenomonas ruminantium TaxID=971 RepID=A0A1I3EPY1_SELRU|nr:TnpV protein [Selenomonas ruminantium]SFI00992.1 hypothetical protein SAMN04487861_11127 [Selenomonas ruminantium]
MLSDEEILAKDYGYWGNIRKRSLYEYRPGEWGLLQDMDRLEYYLEKVNAEYTAKERYKLDIMLKRFCVDEELKRLDAVAWKKRYDRTREYVRKNLREELER